MNYLNPFFIVFISLVTHIQCWHSYNNYNNTYNSYNNTRNYTGIDYYLKLKRCYPYEYKECYGNDDCYLAKKCYRNQVWSHKYHKCLECPRGWVAFNNMCYLMTHHKRTWYDAKKFCESMSARLLTIDTNVYVDFITKFYDRYHLEGSYIVGAYAKGRPSQWYWLNGNKIPARGPWWTECQYPSNTYGDYYHLNEECAEMNEYGLNDINCFSVREKFVCESDNHDEFYKSLRIQEIKHQEYINSKKTLKKKKHESKESKESEESNESKGSHEDKKLGFLDRIKIKFLNNDNSYDDRTEQKGHYNSYCSHSRDCVYGLECINDYCVCPYTYHWSWYLNRCIRCPRGFVFFEGSCYYISSHPSNFTRAHEKCEEYNSHLVTVKTRVIFDFLLDLFREFYMHGKYWVGGLSSGWSDYWLDGCVIQKGPWWNYCDSSYNRPNETMNETLCISAHKYGLYKTNCTDHLPFICRYGMKKVHYRTKMRNLTNSSYWGTY